MFNNIRRAFKAPDKEKEKEKTEELRECPLEKKDLPAMIISAYAVILPVVIGVLALLVLVAFLLIR